MIYVCKNCSPTQRVQIRQTCILLITFFSVKNMGKITYEGNWFLLFSRHLTVKVTSTDVSINNNWGTNRGHGYEIATMIKYMMKYTLFQKDS